MRNQDLSTSVLLAERRRRYLHKVALKEVPKEILKNFIKKFLYNMILLKSAWYSVKLDHRLQIVQV